MRAWRRVVLVALPFVVGTAAWAQWKRPFEKGELPPSDLMGKWEQMLRSPEPSVRLAAVEDMWRARHKETAAMLLAAVSDSDEGVSSEATGLVEMNQKIGIPTAAEPILRLLCSDTPFHRAHGARLAASHAEPGRFAEAMLKAATDSEAEVRAWAFTFFAKTRFPDAEPVLIRAVTEDPKELGRARAAQALYHYASQAACIALMQAAGRDDEYAHGAAFHALITCGNERAIPFLLRNASAEQSEIRRSSVNTIAWAKWFPQELRDATLIKAADDPEIKVRTLTYELIGQHGVVAANKVLRDHLVRGMDSEEESLFLGLSTTADARTSEILLPFAKRPGRIGELALSGVATSGNALLIPELAPLLEHEAQEKRRNLIGAVICSLLAKNPELSFDDEVVIREVRDRISALSPAAHIGRIQLYRPNWAVVEMSFWNHGEQWLLQEVSGQWELLVKYGTWR